MLRQITDGLWVAEQQHRYLGFDLVTRMTALRLANGALWVHSPIHLSDELRSVVDSAGPVAYIVAPNRFHHVFVTDWQRAYPDAQTFGAPGLETKRSDVKFTASLSDNTPSGWAGEIDQAWFETFPGLNEVEFFHRQSRTLIFTDLVFNISRYDGALGRFVLRMDGAFKGPAMPSSFKLYLRFRRAECAAFLDRLLAWDFDRLIFAHGDIVESGGKQALENAWRFAKA